MDHCGEIMCNVQLGEIFPLIAEKETRVITFTDEKGDPIHDKAYAFVETYCADIVNAHVRPPI